MSNQSGCGITETLNTEASTPEAPQSQKHLDVNLLSTLPFEAFRAHIKQVMLEVGLGLRGLGPRGFEHLGLGVVKRQTIEKA